MQILEWSNRQKVYKYLEDNKHKIIELYEQNEKVELIAKTFNCHYNTIMKKLKGWNIPVRHKLSRYIYTINYNFFKSINTEEKAYVLGIMFSDGNVHGKYLTLDMLDKDVLDKIKLAIEYTGPLREKIQKNGKILYILNIYSPQLASDLIKLGCVPNKSLILKFPYEHIPQNLIKHFIRGIFDGDGCICKGKNRKTFIYVIQITGTLEICEGIKKFFNKGSISKCKKAKKTYNWRLSCKHDLIEFLDWIYSNSKIYMDRKYNKYLQIKEELNEI